MVVSPALSAAAPAHPPLFRAAQALETAFLAEMLRAAGAGAAAGAFGGGPGADQFSSFLVDAQARRLVEAGGIGLSERLFAAMAGTRDAG